MSLYLFILDVESLKAFRTHLKETSKVKFKDELFWYPPLKYRKRTLLEPIRSFTVNEIHIL